MRTLLKLVVLAVLFVAVVGYWKDWYSISSKTGDNGKKQITVEWNDDKMMHDIDVVKAKSRDAVNALKDKASKSSGEQKTKLDQSIQVLEAKKQELEDQLAQLKRETGAKATAAKEALQKKIAEYDRAIENALAGH